MKYEPVAGHRLIKLLQEAGIVSPDAAVRQVEIVAVFDAPLIVNVTYSADSRVMDAVKSLKLEEQITLGVSQSVEESGTD